MKMQMDKNDNEIWGLKGKSGRGMREKNLQTVYSAHCLGNKYTKILEIITK